MILQLFLGLIIFIVGFFILLLVIAAMDTNSNGIFVQERVGQHGKIFRIYKFRTLHRVTGRISFFGAWIRKYKLDELPQLWNLLKGDMVLVGPRPDIPGYADQLQGEFRMILQCKPGLTGLASLKYRNEGAILADKPNPKLYNDEVIWPDKTKINLWYVNNQSFILDVQILFLTFFSFNVDVKSWVDKKVNS
ncbi:MAG: sugar transferase [Flavobacterium sp.]